MIQRIAVRIVIEHGGRPLVVRRADGRESILGKYELPGGRIEPGEQPTDAVRRFLRKSLGIDGEFRPELVDALTYTDGDDRSVQYAVLLYRLELTDHKRAIHLAPQYDKYIWYSGDKLEPASLTELSRMILGLPLSVEVKSSTSGAARLPTLFTDGGSRGNPGPSAAGYVLIDESGVIIQQDGEYLGVTTNNQAEYQAVRVGLEAALAIGWRMLELKVDSMLVANQLKGIYTIKNRELWPIYDRVQELLAQFEKVKITHIPRELNQLADGMANKILDTHKSGIIKG
ncbi:MAG: reverse transcriptase-like protein [Candidatus Saccharibacteria bacterium]|nr:reverse transcriptase-like protein [Candidatus Saccharibacteria bacterium]